VIKTTRRQWMEVIVRQTKFADVWQPGLISASGDAELPEWVLTAYAGCFTSLVSKAIIAG